ncbi:MAG: rod shape-determining protein RodA [Candidatus Binatia bacterium]
MFNRRLVHHIDWLLLLLVSLIVLMGVATVSSATYSPTHGERLTPLAIRQFIWAGAGAVALLVFLLIDYRKFERHAYLFYVGVLTLLVLVPAIGYIGGGSRRWIHLGFFTLQPSEPAKLALILVLARFFHRDVGRESYRIRDLLWPAVLFAIPAALILSQPDLGTAVVLGFVFTSMVLVAGVRVRSLAYVVVAALIGISATGQVLWGQLKTYQQKRIVTFLNPEADPLGAGYHIIQSKIAVGSGKIWGKGYRQGTQNQLRFLPEQHTDFIFSVFAEEWGLVCCVLLLLLYCALVWRGLQVVARAKDRFGALVAFGIVATIFWQVVVNISMTTGLLPVVGITLPFFSYGGSSMITLLAGVGLLVNVSMRRFTF